MSTLKSLAKDLLPPLVARKATGLFYGWSGNYPTWEAAEKRCTGYASDEILQRVRSSLLKVKDGKAPYERDGVIFDKVHYSYPLLASLLIALEKDKQLHVLDFGGSLGSTYFQNRKWLDHLDEFSWNVVEQKHFVEEGRRSFENQRLSFHFDIDACLQQRKINVLLLSSVLQYIQEPYAFIKDCVNRNIEYVMIDRTPLLSKGNDRLTIQKVPKSIYDAQYPCWLMNEENVMKAFEGHYDLLFDEVTAERIHVDSAAYRFFFLRKRAH